MLNSATKATAFSTGAKAATTASTARTNGLHRVHPPTRCATTLNSRGPWRAAVVTHPCHHFGNVSTVINATVVLASVLNPKLAQHIHHATSTAPVTGSLEVRLDVAPLTHAVRHGR